MPTNPQLNIRSEITRLKGVPGTTKPNPNEELAGPVPPAQILGNALSAAQDRADGVNMRLLDIEARLKAAGL